MEKVNCTNCGTENSTSNRYCSNCGHELPKLAPPVVEIAPSEPDTFTARFNKRKGLFGALFGAVLFVLFIFLIKSLFFNSSIFERLKSSTVDKTLMTMVEQMNKSCPLDVDQYTRLDNVKFLPGRTLVYNYTLAINKADVNGDELKNNIEPQLLNNVKENPQMQIFRTYKTTFVHIYHDKNGQTICEIPIIPAMYEQ